MTDKAFSREGAAMWIADFESQGKGWPSVEGFLLREYLSGKITLDNCRTAREMFKEMHPYLQQLPKWKLLERYLGKSYATKPILKKRSQPVEVAIEDDEDYFLRRVLEG